MGPTRKCWQDQAQDAIPIDIYDRGGLIRFYIWNPTAGSMESARIGVWADRNSHGWIELEAGRACFSKAPIPITQP